MEVKVNGSILEVKGPKGHLKHKLEYGITVEQKEGVLYVFISEDTPDKNRLYGMQWAIIKNLLQGVSQGFEKRLNLIGVGYRAAVQGNKLDLQVGYSHPTFFLIPPEIKVVVDKGILIIISGVDCQKVGQFAATVRSLKPPEPYKGKGIRYENEYVRKKAGKAAKAAAPVK